jgi:hypothetical protein
VPRPRAATQPPSSATRVWARPTFYLELLDADRLLLHDPWPTRTAE